jgi:hypothetical protein
MKHDLVYLVMDRAPVDARPFRTLLYMALQANSLDIAYAPAKHIAAGMRMRIQHAQDSIPILLAANLITQIEQRRSYYVVRRDTLWRNPSVKANRLHRFQGVTVDTLEAQIGATVDARVARTISVVSKVVRAASDRKVRLLEACSDPNFP